MVNMYRGHPVATLPGNWSTPRVKSGDCARAWSHAMQGVERADAESNTVFGHAAGDGAIKEQ